MPNPFLYVQIIIFQPLQFSISRDLLFRLLPRERKIVLYIYIYIYIQSASENTGCGLFIYRIYEEYHINL